MTTPTVDEITHHIQHWTTEYRSRTDEAAKISAEHARDRWIEMWLDTVPRQRDGDTEPES